MSDLPKEEAARVVAAMRRLKREKFKSNAALGRAIGRSGTSVGELLSAHPRNSPSLETAGRVARLIGVDTRALLEGTEAHGGEVEAKDEYPERASALRRLAGLLPDEVSRTVKSRVQVPSEAKLTEEEWISLALLLKEEHQREARLRRLVRT